MAKKKGKKEPSRTEAVRSAVDQAFQAGQSQFSKERAQEIVDELTQAAGRARQALDDLRPPTGDDVRALRDEVAALRARVEALEARPAPRRAAPRKKPPAKRGGTGSAGA
jgi:polyhydroxyalkanoate synthesis regulator phasin